MTEKHLAQSPAGEFVMFASCDGLPSFCESTACVGRENLAYDQRNGTPLP